MERNMPSVLIATSNKGKFAEIQKILGELDGIKLLSLSDVARGSVNVVENGATFKDNALIKAKAYGDASGLIAIADDSGLEVDFLNGAPGINSARYAGIGAEDSMLVQKLLNNMKDAEDKERGARFKCVACLYDPKTKENIFTEGECEGKIAFEPRGKNGFGYDPIFIVDGSNGKTMAELTPDIKNQMSHRAKAFMALKKELTKSIIN
ncbi:MAG: RdgB/HAM1 family non-canonical purine NTP pyrophosphatase [Pseudomonadota bacterium]